jgi:hypothetical protein
MTWTGVLAALARPMVLLDRRVRWLESALDLPLAAGDIASVRVACAAGRQRLGHYYHWYFLKLLQARIIRRADRRRILRLVDRLDRTDYAALDGLPAGRGLLVAIPHHSHYVFSMIALARRLQRHRRVHLFYGAPGTHPGNEVFDALHDAVWKDDPAVDVLHDDRRGLARALEGLRRGDAVIIMPDVFRDESGTLLVPFCGRPMNAMLGTATLARRTGATIIPAVPRTVGPGMAFATRFAAPLEACGPEIAPRSAAERLIDYATTRRLFARFESFMAGELIHWQNVRQHLSREAGFPQLARDGMDRVADLLSSSPLLQRPLAMVELESGR